MIIKLPHISVITLTYNHEKYIDKCIKSVLHQTFNDWELLIVNDGSNDATLKICEHYAARDKRIRVFSQENKGLEKIGINYNYALSQATGKYVAILEGDDFWNPKKIEIYNNQMEITGSVMGYGIAFITTSDGKIIDTFPKKHIISHNNIMTNNPPGVFYQIYLRKSFIPSATLVFKNDKLKEIGGFQQAENMQVVDYATVLSMIPMGTFSFITEPLAYYRIHAEQATSSANTDTGCSARFALEFFKSLTEKEQESINISVKELERHIKTKQALRLFNSGRKNLIWKNKRAALVNFKSMLRFPYPTILLRSMAGIICLLLNINFEKIASIFGFRRLG